MFLVDESGSVGSRYFRFQMQLIADFISGFKIGTNTAQFGLVTFATYAVAEFYLNSYHDMNALQTKTKSIPYNNTGGTNTGKGLDFVRETMFNPNNGGRNDAKHIVILMTDGSSNSRKATTAAAEKIHKANITFIGMGIGSGANKKELQTVIQKANNLILVDNFTLLHGQKDRLHNVTCEGRERYLFSTKMIK